jgi:Flp pilus assembly protein TadG
MNVAPLDPTVLFTAENLSTDAIRKRLNDLAILFCTRLLPRSDMASKPMRTLVTEMVASYVLWPLVEYLSDPININSLILSTILQSGVPTGGNRTAQSAGQQGESGAWTGSGRADINILLKSS